MQNKSTAVYKRILQIVKSNVDTSPTSVMTDFEQAAINAFKEVFGSNLTIRTCLFHLSQSIHRHIKRNGLSHIYSSNEDYRTLVRSLAALSFLPVRQVEPAFQLLLTEFWKLDLLSIAESVFSYFKRNYIHVQGARNSPLFPPTVWNQKETQDGVLGRTNNAQESFHCQLNAQLRKKNPAFSKAIDVIKKEELVAETKLREYELDPTVGLLVRPRSVQSQSTDLAIWELIEIYDTLQTPTDEETLQHLKALQFRIMKNGFDNWDD